MAGSGNKAGNLTAEEQALVENWHLPDVEDGRLRSSKKTSAMGHSVDWYYQQRQQELQQAQEEEELKPLTAEDIEAIRQSAYDEGLLQGHEEGYEKGHGEGLEKGHLEGVEKGHAEGHASGMAAGSEAVQAQAVRWQELVHQLNNPLLEVNEGVEKQLVELCVKLAEAVIGVEVKTNEKIIFHTLKECVDALPYNDADCQISLSPEDFALVSNAFSEEELHDRGWHIKADPVIEQGGCIVESRTSSIDRTIKERIKSTLERFLLDSGINDGS